MAKEAIEAIRAAEKQAQDIEREGTLAASRTAAQAEKQAAELKAEIIGTAKKAADAQRAAAVAEGDKLKVKADVQAQDKAQAIKAAAAGKTDAAVELVFSRLF